MSTAPDPSPAICSAKACTRDASWVLRWNNPRIHTPERRKAWAACDDHRESLSDFLAARSFLCDVVPIAEAEADAAEGEATD